MSTFVVGVNHHDCHHSKHVVSNASVPPTACPIAKVLHEIRHHQRYDDHYHILATSAYWMPVLINATGRATMNIVPTSTSAAKAVALIVPEEGQAEWCIASTHLMFLWWIS